MNWSTFLIWVGAGTSFIGLFTVEADTKFHTIVKGLLMFSGLILLAIGMGLRR